MTESALILASEARAVTSAGQPVSPGSGRDLCIYCRTDKFVFWPPASRLPSASCPGCRRRSSGR
jgi:hypothetical protein